MRIDSHQHFWNYSAKEYSWIDEKAKRIARDFLPPDLEVELRKANLDGCIAVQARQTVDESRWLLNLADHYPIIKGVVGWVDLRSARLEDELAELSKHRRFVGVRHVVQDEPDDQFMLRPDFLRGIGKLKQFGLVYDILIYAKQLGTAVSLVTRFPEQVFVLDHIAKPSIKLGTLSPWDQQMRELANNPKVYCKISGMVTEANWNGWKGQDFRSYLDVAFEVFGPDRLLYGSDWPVCLLAATYEQVYSLVHDYVMRHAAKAESKIFGDNALKTYRRRD